MGADGFHGNRQLAPLLFEPFASAPDGGFWASVAKYKLNEGKLDDAAVDVVARYGACARAGVSGVVACDSSALDDAKNGGKLGGDGRGSAGREWICRGQLRCLNTREALTTIDREGLVRGIADSIAADIESGAVESDPGRLNAFGLVAYTCLKTWRFTYWFAFPTLVVGEEKIQSTKIEALESDVAGKATVKSCEEWLASGGASAWLLSEDGREAYPLSEFKARSSAGCQMTLAFADACCSMTHPGAALRNLAVMVSMRWNLSEIDVVCVRLRKGHVDAEACLKFTMTVPRFDKSSMKVVGWERNERGKTGPRLVDLGQSMDPTQLASQAVDLNLKLMRWRLLPELNREKLADTKCLLIGAGTLGCAVARTLMGWGVTAITFIDSGNVSYSNPVRQSLFEFKDCLEGGAPKAMAAAAKLAEIFPGMKSRGVIMSIPMPGHNIAEHMKSSTFQDVDELERLIDEHDVVYILTDTRESRWLPTVICASKNKLCINTALGFNTYLVMRHGCGVDSVDGSVRLGCYFCNDVMAPANSTKDRTLDQQCTVTRPGLAPIASALAAELMVALLHSEKGAQTAPPTREPTKDAEAEAEPSPLGVAPHQIRGSVAGFTQTLFDAPCFPRCTACSTTVVSRYRADRDGFLLSVFEDPKTLEDATGLTELLGRIDLDDAEWFDDDDDDDASGDDF